MSVCVSVCVCHHQKARRGALCRTQSGCKGAAGVGGAQRQLVARPSGALNTHTLSHSDTQREKPHAQKEAWKWPRARHLAMDVHVLCVCVCVARQ